MCQIKGGLNKSESYAGWKSLRFDFRIFQVWRSLENYLHLFSCSKICFLPCVFVSLLFHFFFLTDFLSSLLSLLSFICSTFRLSFFLYSLLLCCSFFDCFFLSFHPLPSSCSSSLIVSCFFPSLSSVHFCVCVVFPCSLF